MKKNGFAPIIILVLIALTVAGYFGYKNYWPKLQSFVTPTPIATADPTADWKTYTVAHLFSISYPNTLTCVNSELTDYSDACFSNLNPNSANNFGFVVYYGDGGTYGKKSDQFDIPDYADIAFSAPVGILQNPQRAGAWGVATKLNDLTINGHPAVFLTHDFNGDQQEAPIYTDGYLIKNGNYYYEIRFSNTAGSLPRGGLDQQRNLEIKIVNSFQILH